MRAFSVNWQATSIGADDDFIMRESCRIPCSEDSVFILNPGTFIDLTSGLGELSGPSCDLAAEVFLGCENSAFVSSHRLAARLVLWFCLIFSAVKLD
jgi:hypothetical protein